MLLGECKAWDFVNSRGDTICGRYYLPPHFDPNKKYPSTTTVDAVPQAVILPAVIRIMRMPH